MLGASRGEGGILGEGVRQAQLRDPTYGPALERGPEALSGSERRDRGRRGSGARVRGDDARRRRGRRPHRAHRRLDAAGGLRGVRRARRASVAVDLAEHPRVVRRRAVRGARRRALELPDGARGAARPARRARPRPTGCMASAVRPRAPRATRPSSHDAGEPEFDLLLLGHGPRRTRRLAVPGPGDARRARPARRRGPEAGLEPFVPRISLTLTAIGRARARWRSSSRARGRPTRSRRRSAPAPSRATMCRPRSCRGRRAVTVLLDPAAAAKL